MVGAGFGGLAVGLDPEAKAVILPFPQLLGDPADRVAEEESGRGELLAGRKARFSGQLMTNNIKVAIARAGAGVDVGAGDAGGDPL